MHSTLFLSSISLCVTCTLASQVLNLHRRTFSQNAISSAGASLDSTTYGKIFDVEIEIGNQSFILLVDTGSSDLWVLSPDWQCFNTTSGDALPREGCALGNATYTPSPTFSQIPEEWLGAQYGSGTVSGIIGTENVTLAGITVRNQTFGVGNLTSNPGDGTYDGIIGFGYPSMTSSHPGLIANTNLTNDTLYAETVPYNPVVFSMYNQGLIEPYFSIAIERTSLNASDGPGGYLALGSLPPVSFDPNFAMTPVVIPPVPVNYTGGSQTYSWWAITVEAILYGTNGSTTGSGSSQLVTNSTPFEAIVDTGNFFTFLPGTIATAINNAFDPPAVAIPDSLPLQYAVGCSATPPPFALQIGGRKFFHNPADMIYSNGDGSCVSSVVNQDGESFAGVSGSIIGDPLLKNVVAVFDFGRNEMRFAPREQNTTGTANSSSVPTTTPTSVLSSGAVSASELDALLCGWSLAVGCMVVYSVFGEV